MLTTSTTNHVCYIKVLPFVLNLLPVKSLSVSIYFSVRNEEWMFVIYLTYNIHNFMNPSNPILYIYFQDLKVLAYFIPLPIDAFPCLFSCFSHFLYCFSCYYPYPDIRYWDINMVQELGQREISFNSQIFKFLKDAQINLPSGFQNTEN